MKISFVIPSYNTALWLPHAVQSCLDQSYKDIEIVIVNDCSKDSTSTYLQWLSKQKYKNIVIINNEKNLGRSESRNIGNKASSGDVICVLDADDLAVVKRAEYTSKKIKATNADFVYGSAVMIDSFGNILKELHANPIIKEEVFAKMANGIVHSTVAYKKELALKYPYQSGKIADLGIDDWEQQVRMIKDGVKMDLIPDVICAYHALEGSVTNTRNIEELIKLKKEILGDKCPI